MRSISPTILFGAVMAIASTVSAQVSSIANSGCSDGLATGSKLYSVGGDPRIGNTLFAIEHVCPFGANAAFFTMGDCEPLTPLPDWPLADSCFAAWVSPPNNCGQVWTPGLLRFLDGGLARQGKVIMSFPLPNISGIVGWQLCLQFVCVDLNASNPCIGVSEGLSITFMS